MKHLIFTLSLSIFCFLSSASFAQNTTVQKKEVNPSFQVVESSCGQCQFGLQGKGCSLAVRIDGKAYFVDGTNMDKHGDAHAKDGMCNAIRKAEVGGEIKNDRFVASSFKLLPASEEKK